MDVRKFKFFINIIICPLALTMNGILIYLIYSKSNRLLTNYKKVLYLGVSVDIIYSLISFLFAPTTVIYEQVYFVLLEGILRQLTKPLTIIAFVLNVWATYFCIATAQVQFVYRYLLICKNKELNNIAFFGLVLTAVVSSGICGFINYLGFGIFNTKEDLIYYQSLTKFLEWPDMSIGKTNYAASKIVSSVILFHISDKITIYKLILGISEIRCLSWYLCCGIFLHLDYFLWDRYPQNTQKRSSEVFEKEYQVSDPGFRDSGDRSHSSRYHCCASHRYRLGY